MSIKISVYITSYNQKAYLVEAIESVLNQTLKPFQIIIVDDCSTDGSQEVINDYASRYPGLITPVYHTLNKGIAQTRIDALKAVTGDYVNHVDGDDRFLPTKLEKEAKLLQDNPNAKIAFSNYYVMTADGIHTQVWIDKDLPPQGDVFRRTFIRDFPKHSLFRNELVEYQAWKRVGFYDPNLDLFEDYEMLIRLTKKLRVVYYNEPLAEYRRHKMGLSWVNAAQYLATLEYIYLKNKPLLDDLSVAEKKDVQRKLGEWMAKIARQAAHEAINDDKPQLGGKVQALKYYVQALKYQPCSFDYRLILKILFPHRLYGSLRKISHRVWRNKLSGERDSSGL